LKRREAAFAALGVILVAVCSIWISRRARHASNFVIEQKDCHIPVTLIEPHVAYGSAMVLHGLSANRLVMKRLGDELAANGIRTYLIDLPGHGVNSDSFTFARTEECAGVAVESLMRDHKISADNTAIVGHSMGSAVAVRLADRIPTIATVAISPAPMVFPRRMPANLLVFSAQFDLPLLRRVSLALEQASEGDRTRPSDFAERRAFELEHIRGATHTSLLFTPYVLQQTVDWIRRAVGAPIRGLPMHAPNLQPAATIGLLGLFLCFPAAATLVTRLFGAGRTETETEGPRNFRSLLQWTVAALFGVSVLNFFTPLRFVHLFTGDYLASLLLVTGVVLLALQWGGAKSLLRSNARADAAAAGLGVAAFLVAGAWLSWQLTEAWLTPARWLRFAFILPAVFPYCLAEEIALGAPSRRGGRRLLLFLVLRLLLWLACILALYAFLSGQIMILILVVYLAGFSIVERLGTDVIRRRTGSVTGAAIFGAILAAWFIAAVFPLT
jgi:pimeloyl-ACP methyl ester carboxylesterase